MGQCMGSCSVCPNLYSAPANVAVLLFTACDESYALRLMSLLDDLSPAAQSRVPAQCAQALAAQSSTGQIGHARVGLMLKLPCQAEQN